MRQKLKQFPMLAAALLLALVVRLLTTGLSWVGVAALLLTLVWFGIEFVRWLMLPSERGVPPRSQPDDTAQPPEPVVSLVYFLSEPRETDEATVREEVSHRFGIDFDLSSRDPEHFISRFTPPDSDRPHDDEDIAHYLLKIPQGLFAVLVSKTPYVAEPGRFARQSIRDKRLRHAIEEHRAWLSVDLVEAADDPERVTAAYRTIGKLLAAFAGPDCLAVYCPELQRCNEFDPSLIDTLAGPDPLDLFDEPTFEPIIEVADDDPAMAAAVGEAVRRWPEFAEAFRNRGHDQPEGYIVKAEFREGRKAEYMWIAVFGIDDDRIDGELLNDPHELMDVYRGAPVSIALNRLNDWIYPDQNGSHVGGFTLDVLAAGDD